MQKLTNLLFELLAIILEKRRGLYFPGFYSEHRESVLISMIRDYNVKQQRHESNSANNSLYWNM